MLKFKAQLSGAENLIAAAKLRVQDYSFTDLLPKEIDTSVGSYLKRINFFFSHTLTPSLPMVSATYREFLRDLRFLITFNNLEFTSLFNEVNLFNRKNIKRLHAIQSEIDILDQKIIEQEFKFYKDYDYVDHNNFSRRIEKSSEELTRWNYDYKTGLGFDQQEHAAVFPHTGITLPVLESNYLPFSSCEIVYEESDVGDTKTPLVINDPVYCIVPNKTFRYVIFRKEFDETRRLYQHTPSYLTLMLSFSNTQLINYLEIVPAGINILDLVSISYINETNEEVLLGSEIVQVPTGIRIFLESVKAKHLKLKFRQLAPVSKQVINSSDDYKDINSVLEGLGWSTKFDTHSTKIEGRAFDFSIKEIKAYLNKYNNIGYYAAHPKTIQGIATAKIVSSLHELPINVSTNISEGLYTLPTGSTYTEFYLGVKAKKKGQLVFNDLIPIPDTYPIQFEALPISGGLTKLKLYPDLTFGNPKVKILSIEKQRHPKLLVTTESAHNLVPDQEFVLLAPSTTDLTGTYNVIAVVDEFSFTIRIQDWSKAIEIDENSRPHSFLCRTPLQDPIVVYKNEIEQTIGTHYHIGIGNGNYYTFWDLVNYQDYLANIPRSGDFTIKILNPSYTDNYRIEYKPLANQYLGQSKLVQLKNGSVSFDKKFSNWKSDIQTIVLLRSSISNYYTTSVLSSYTLGIKRY